MYPSSAASLFDILAKKSTQFVVVRLLVVVAALATSAGTLLRGGHMLCGRVGACRIPRLDFTADFSNANPCVSGKTPSTRGVSRSDHLTDLVGSYHSVVLVTEFILLPVTRIEHIRNPFFGFDSVMVDGMCTDHK